MINAEVLDNAILDYLETSSKVIMHPNDMITFEELEEFLEEHKYPNVFVLYNYKDQYIILYKKEVKV